MFIKHYQVCIYLYILYFIYIYMFKKKISTWAKGPKYLLTRWLLNHTKFTLDFFLMGFLLLLFLFFFFFFLPTTFPLTFFVFFLFQSENGFDKWPLGQQFSLRVLHANIFSFPFVITCLGSMEVLQVQC